MFDFSHCYYRFADDVVDRIDTLYNDTIFDVVELSVKNVPYKFVPLEQVANIKHESRDPQETPDDEFTYVDIGSVNTIKGKTKPEKMLGRDAKSSRIRRVIHKDEILVSTTRPTRNAICIVPSELDNQICTTGFAVLETKNEVLSEFLFYALRSNLSNMQFEKYCSGSGYPSINQEKDLPKIIVPKPDKNSQKEIIDKIKPLEIEAEELESIADYARVEASNLLLIELGLETPRNTNYFFRSGAEKESSAFFQFISNETDRLHFLFYHPKYAYLNNLIDKYKTVMLESICKETIHRGEQVTESENGTHLLLKTVHLKNGYIDFENAAKVTETVFNANPKAQVQKGDILITSTGYVSMGKVDIYNNNEPALVDGHISIIRPKDDYDPYFVTYFLRSHLGQLQVEKWWTGSSGQIELPQLDLAKFVIISNEPLPLKMQTKVANKVTEKLLKVQELESEAQSKRNEAKHMFEQFIFGKVNI